jgi:hypothetical protein
MDTTALFSKEQRKLSRETYPRPQGEALRPHVRQANFEFQFQTAIHPRSHNGPVLLF